MRVHVNKSLFLQRTWYFPTVDAYSKFKWNYLYTLYSTPTTERYDSSLELLFTTHGYPETLVTDSTPSTESFDRDVYYKSTNIKLQSETGSL